MIIISYTVLLIELPTNTNFTYQRGGYHTEIFVTDLHPYYEYSCSVAAETSVGLGPFSAPFTLTTHQDGGCMYNSVAMDTIINQAPCFLQLLIHHPRMFKGGQSTLPALS